MGKSVLCMNVGLPLSGKSTFTDTLTTWQIVCPDDIRLALGHEFYGPLEPVVWSIAETQVRALLERGAPRILVDATNITRWERSKWKRMSTEYDAICGAFLFKTPPGECIKRAELSDRQHMIPVIERMAKRQEAIDRGELLKTLRIT